MISYWLYIYILLVYLGLYLCDHFRSCCPVPRYKALAFPLLLYPTFFLEKVISHFSDLFPLTLFSPLLPLGVLGVNCRG